MCIVDKIIKELQNSLKEKDNEIFLSEADLQFCFAQKAKEQGAENIVLEYPIKTSELYDYNVKDGRIKDGRIKDGRIKDGRIKEAFCFCGKDIDKDKTYIDVKFEYNNEIYFVELKYKTSELDCVTRHGRTGFKLFEQSACNLGLYAIYEDIERMENIIEAHCETERYEGKSIKSYILAITNDCGYWNKHNRGYIQNVSLENGKKTLKNNCLACEKSKAFEMSLRDEKNKEYISINKKPKGQCGRPICLKNQYNIDWKVFKSFLVKDKLCTNNKRGKNRTSFRYLKIDLTKDRV